MYWLLLVGIGWVGMGLGGLVLVLVFFFWDFFRVIWETGGVNGVFFVFFFV